MSLTLRENATCNILSEHHASYFSYANKCAPHFDRSLCWYNVSFGEVGYRDCPFTFCYSVPGCERLAMEHRASRVCTSAGTWNSSVYDQCLEILENHQHCISGYCRTCPDVLRETVINVSLALSVISVGLLVVALVLFSLFDSIQCRRLSIHKNLALAFVFRFTVLALWTVTNTSNLFRDCSQYTPMPLKSLILTSELSGMAMQNDLVVCNLFPSRQCHVDVNRGHIFVQSIYGVCNAIWRSTVLCLFASRMGLVVLRTLRQFNDLGFPLVVVLLWTGVHEYHSSANHLYCWLPYAQGFHLWILAGTMGAALLLNVVVLLAIVVILVQKLRTDNSAESKKIWKTVKATILLVPLLGISNIPLFYEPDKPSAIYMLGSAILQHSQGIFIAVLYCFLNGEVRGAIRRQLTKLPFSSVRSRLSHRVRFETERTYVPDPGTINQRHGVPMEELNCRNHSTPAAPPQTAADTPIKSNARSTNASSSNESSSPPNSLRADEGDHLCNENTIVQF
ncbi:hypothetical protein M3Y98_00360300 [Aphelenchoides besseyi]|nr:hypothetical protein M3Y98_00360300 [Aphelenchoides besseyi]KAI6201704.1 hypothetical protein M3Y96_00870800 [Aphelenchoides besseyi]